MLSKNLLKILFTCIVLTLLALFYISVIPIMSFDEFDRIQNEFSRYSNNIKHRLVLLVPFRDRFDELLLFVPHLTKFLKLQNITFTINIINQSDKYRFNRGSLINAGYLLNKHKGDYLILHDVDLLPLNMHLNYGYPNGVYHISSPSLHPKYHYEKFFGGILAITNENFELVNGFSNRYWGWGLEDDEFYTRIHDSKLNISRPIGLKTGINSTFLHIHNSLHRKRDYAKIFNQREVTRKRDRETGLNSVNYKLISQNELIIDGCSCTVMNVKLECDLNLTPWCVLARNKKTKN